MPGLLRVAGTIDLGQFWPSGESDADTTKIIVTVGANAFRFRAHAGAAFQITHAFENARVRGQVTKPCIDNQGRITVRLQGIDAPELHYTPQAARKKAQQTQSEHSTYLAWNKKYRQYLAETATVKLRSLLSRAGRNPLPCIGVTAVDQPDEVFDTYARFVGNILAKLGGREVNINTWLVQQGWAFPAFYSSMSRQEINVLMAARRKNKGVYRRLHHFVRSRDFDWTLVYRGRGAVPNPAADAGPVIIPKLFRRLSAWAVNQRAGMVKASFRTYLHEKQDECHLTQDFFQQGRTAATTHTLDAFLRADGRFTRRPEELVFREKPSQLVGPGGRAVSW